MDPRVCSALTIVRQSTDRHVTVTDVASAVGLSDSRFEHLLRQETGSTFRELLLDVRLSEAISLAADPRLRVTEIAAGADLRTALPGVDWRRDGRTLVLGVSTQCHFCTASAPFLRQIAASVGKEGVKIVAVFPQPVAEAQKYLAGERVRVDQVMQLPLTRIGVRGTPTMILANRKGVVTNVWVGEQSPAEQPAVLRILTDAPAPVAAHR